MNWFANKFFKLTGGRPMICNGRAFMDRVSWEMVYYYTDRLGRQWLATSAWALFRTKPKSDCENNKDKECEN